MPQDLNAVSQSLNTVKGNCSPISRDQRQRELTKKWPNSLQDVVNLCELGEFEPDIFLISFKTVRPETLMQYHRDLSQKLAKQ
jgi:hypothetical protein